MKTSFRYDAEKARKHTENVLRRQDRMTAASREISEGFPWEGVNWSRRKKAKKSLKAFCETYLKSVCSLGWSEDQKVFLSIAEKSMRDGGKCAVGMPRGGGKSTLSRAAVLWGICYGYTKFVTLIASNERLATRAMEFIKAHFRNNPLLKQDFPEICWPIGKLNNRANLARSQTCFGVHTDIAWGNDSIKLPIIVFPEDAAQWYRKNDKQSVRKVVKNDGSEAFMSVQSWTIVNVAGITGNVRGSNETHPMTLEVVRPDFVILDDIQDDSSAKNPDMVKQYIRLVDGAIEGLAGPTATLSGLMPCTVIAMNDVADQFLDREVRPEWHGVRCKMILEYPEGIDDYSISPATESGRLWLEYVDLRKKSHQVYHDNRLAKEFYRKNQKAMDEGFKVSWEHRYSPKTECSAIQAAMEKRIKNPETFAAEYQQIGVNLNEAEEPVITAREFADKVIMNAPKGKAPDWVQEVCAFIDLQEECTFWTVLGFKNDFTSIVLDYGTFPEIQYKVFTKRQIDSWQLLTNHFMSANNVNQQNWVVDKKSGKVKASPEAKYTWGVSKTVELLKSKVFTRLDMFNTKLKISTIGIDATRGQNTAVVRQFCAANSGVDGVALYPHFGQYVSPNAIQMAEQQRKPHWVFESDWNHRSRTCKWILKQTSQTGFEFHTDTSQMKDFLMARLSTSIGSPGCMYLYGAEGYVHEQFCYHVCESEYPEKQIGKIVKNHWKVRSNNQDNDWLDCLTGCCTLASWKRACVDNADGLPDESEINYLTEISQKKMREAGGRDFRSFSENSKFFYENPVGRNRNEV